MTIAQRMIPELKSEAAMTRKLLAKIPDDKLSFSPGGGLQTIGWNASHLVETIGWVKGIVNASGLDLADVDAEQAAALGGSNDVSALLKLFDANLAASLAALEGVSDATLDGPWTMRYGGRELFTMKKGDCLRKWIFTHSAHHRGILSAMLRIAGVEHRSIYEE